jgi:serine/threonine protein kinase
MDRYEVLKVLNPAMLEKPGAKERFLREIRSAARLQHANVVGAYNAMQVGNLLVFAMEYVPGTDLARLVKDHGPLPVANACLYIYHAALGLQHAHERGMVHRDIKPGNLILTKEHRKSMVKVLDFGLAKAESEKGGDSDLTGEGKMLGTPDYMAPEQSLDATRADIRADIYSLGCSLYAILAGKPPFKGETAFAVIQHHHLSTAPLLSAVRADVPEGLAKLVARMMAKRPEERPQTPMEVWKALAEYIKPPAPGTKPAPVISIAPQPAPTMDWIQDAKKLEKAAKQSKASITPKTGLAPKAEAPKSKSKSKSDLPKLPLLPSKPVKKSGTHRPIAPAAEWQNTLVEAPAKPVAQDIAPPIPLTAIALPDAPAASAMPVDPGTASRGSGWSIAVVAFAVLVVAGGLIAAYTSGAFEPKPFMMDVVHTGSSSATPIEKLKEPKNNSEKKTESPHSKADPVVMKEPTLPKLPLPADESVGLSLMKPTIADSARGNPGGSSKIVVEPPAKTVVPIPPKNVDPPNGRAGRGSVPSPVVVDRSIVHAEPIDHHWELDSDTRFSQRVCPSTDSSTYILFGDSDWADLKIRYRVKITSPRPNSTYAAFAVCGVKAGNKPNYVGVYLEYKPDLVGRLGDEMKFRHFLFPGKRDFGSEFRISEHNINPNEYADCELTVDKNKVTLAIQQLNKQGVKNFYSYRVTAAAPITGMVGFKTMNCSATFEDLRIDDLRANAPTTWSPGPPNLPKK